MGERSQATPPSTHSVPSPSSSSVIARVPTTSPPPPMPISRARSASLSAFRGTASPSHRGHKRPPHISRYGLRPSLQGAAAWWPLGEDEVALDDLADRARGAIELL